MKKDKIYEEYLNIISQSSIKDSLGGKMISGIGSLFKKGTKLASDGIKKGAEKIEAGVKNKIQHHKNTKELKETIDSLAQIFKAYDSVAYKVSKKPQIDYILNSANSSINSSLMSFFNMFKECGRSFGQLCKNSPDVLNRPDNELLSLIEAPIQKRVTNFKQTSKISTQSIEDVYSSIISEAIQDELIQKAGKNGFVPVDVSKPNELKKQIIISNLPPAFLGKLSPELDEWQNEIQNDKVKVNIVINNDQIICTINSEFLKKDITLDPIKCGSADKFNSKMIDGIISYYKKEHDEQQRTSNLNNSMNNAKYSKFERAFLLSQDVIINRIKFGGWFSSIIDLLETSSNSNIDENQLKFMCIVFYQCGIIDVIK